MAGHASFRREMHGFVREDLARVAAEAVVIGGLDPGMGLVAFVAVQSRHGHLFRKARFRGLPVAGETALAVGNEFPLLIR